VSETVSLIPCADYDPKLVSAALKESLDLLGGLERFVQPGQRVLLKVNLLMAADPEKAITTHPAVVEAMVRMVQALGAHPVIGDSPGAVPYTPGGLRRAYRVSGLQDVAARTGAELNFDTTVVSVSNPDGVLIKRFEVIRPAVEADVLISMPKLKTHMFTWFTGATKNLFGVVPGVAKVGYHGKLPTLDRFAEMLLDLIVAVRPALHVMDGVLAMEGDGPGLRGRPRHAGGLLASSNAAALDAVACDLIGLDPMRLELLQAAVRRGWWSGRVEDIEVLGAQREDISLPGFKLPSSMAKNPRAFDRLGVVSERMAEWLIGRTRYSFTPRPEPQAHICTGCKLCVNACPQQAITIRNRHAVIDDKNCIRCYCCHELCPEAAVDIRFSPLGRAFRRIGLIGRS